MNTYKIHFYNKNSGVDRTFEVNAISAFNALEVADIGLPQGTVETTSHKLIEVWREKAGDAANLAASDNRHWQRNIEKGTIGAQAWRID